MRGSRAALERAGGRDCRIARGVAVRVWRWPSGWPPISPRAAWSSSAAWRAASIRRRIAARSRPAASTVAVLGSGVDVIYPPEHAALARDDRSRTARVVSELVPGTPPLPQFFPLRNRIISGLSRAVVVIEAGEKSGSLITARCALEQGRDVLAVPGNVLSGRNRGAHALLRDGAKIVESADDILEELGMPRGRPVRRRRARARRAAHQRPDSRVPDAGRSRAISTRLPSDPGLTTARLLPRLFELELQGLVQRRRRRPVRPD